MVWIYPITTLSLIYECCLYYKQKTNHHKRPNEGQAWLSVTRVLEKASCIARYYLSSPPAWAKPNWLIMELLCCRKSGSLFLVLIQFQWSLSLADSFSKPLTFLSLKYTVFYFSGVIHISWIFWIHLLKNSFRFSYWFVQWGFTAVGGDESFYVLWVSHRIIHSSIRWVKPKKTFGLLKQGFK